MLRGRRYGPRMSTCFSLHSHVPRLLGILGWVAWILGLGASVQGAAMPRNEAAIAAVAQGLTDTAFADAWGFDPSDATASVQAAIDSRARVVIVPFTGAPWVLRPVTLRGDLELIFEAGVLVLAKAGEFQGGGDSMFRATDATNITVRGHGATLRMRKKDYQQPPYTKAEWRMGLAFLGCRDVHVEGLRIESTGGDGIYIGSSKANRWCENVTIRNCVCHDNHRQGISVISAVHLLIEHCTLSGTAGTPPEAGIDLEPDEPDERLVDCVIRNCVVADNAGNGILVWLKPLTSASVPVSIRFENCHVRMGPAGGMREAAPSTPAEGWSGFVVGEVADDGPRGLIEFIRCTSENTGREGARLSNKSAKGVRVRFVSCRWKNTWRAPHPKYGGPRSPILIRSHTPERCTVSGGIEFVECQVEDDLDAAVVRFEDDDGTGSLKDIRGMIQVHGMTKPRLRLGAAVEDVSLRLVEVPVKKEP